MKQKECVLISNGAIGMGRNTASYRIKFNLGEAKVVVQYKDGIYLSAGTGNSNHAFYVELIKMVVQNILQLE